MKIHTSTKVPSHSGTTKCTPPCGCSRENSIPIRKPRPSATIWDASGGIVTNNSPALLSGSTFRAAERWWFEKKSRDRLKF